MPRPVAAARATRRWALALGLAALGAACAPDPAAWSDRLARAPDPFERRLAALALGEAAGRGLLAPAERRDAATALVAALDDVDEAVRAAAADGLLASGRAALPALFAADGPHVIALLGRLATAIPALPAELLARDDPERRPLMLDVAVQAWLRRSARGDDEAAARLRELGEEALPALVLAFKSEDEAVAQAARDGLARLGAACLPPLLEATGARNMVHVERVGLLVAQLGEAALPPLLAILRAPGQPARVQAAMALAALGAQAASAQSLLLVLLASPDRDLGLACAWALSRIPPADGAQRAALLSAFDGADGLSRSAMLPGIESACLDVLAQGPESVRPLAERLLADLRAAQAAADASGAAQGR